MASNVGHTGISEAYDYRVALPLIVVALLGLLFVEVNGHKPITLQSTSASSSKRLVKHQPIPKVSSATNLPTLSSNIETKDLAPGETPYDIQTASPQNSSGNGYEAGNSSTDKLQNSTNYGSNALTSKGSKTLSPTNIENIINGTSNTTIKSGQTVQSIL